jgi:hypothetical protein
MIDGSAGVVVFWVHAIRNPSPAPFPPSRRSDPEELMRSLGWLVLPCLLMGSEARGCSVPVFRYALEHWRPGAHEVFVFHRGPLSAPDRALVRKLETAADKANLTLTVADVAGGLAPETAKVWQRIGASGTLPRLVVFAPEEAETAPPLWSGPLDESSIRQLLDSPRRRRIVELLTKGESVVWVLLGSGEAKADEAGERLLKTELSRLQKALDLPELKEQDSLRSSLPLRISFAMAKVSRTDADESFLVQTLLASEEGLTKVKGPIVFPVFGRGRVLLALNGKELSAGSLERWASFLCGPCSCRVKEATPGTDLLISAEWDELLETPPEKSPPVQPTITAPPIPPGRSEPEEPPLAEPEPRSCRCWLWGGVSAGSLVLLAAGAWLIRSRIRTSVA